MPSSILGRIQATALVVAVLLGAHFGRLVAQVPTGQSRLPSGQLPSPQEAQEILRNQPELVQQLRDRLAASGLTPDQVRARLRAAVYPEGMLDDYLQGADTTQPA